MVGNYHVGGMLFNLLSTAGLYRPCRHRPDVECGPKGGELVQYHKTPVKGFGQTPDETGATIKENGGQGDEDDVENGHSAIDHKPDI